MNASTKVHLHVSFLFNSIINRRHFPSLLLLPSLSLCPRDKPTGRHRCEWCVGHVRTVRCHWYTSHWRTKSWNIWRFALEHCGLDHGWRTIRIMIGWMLVPQRERSTAKRVALGAGAGAGPRAIKSLSAKCKRSRRTLCPGLVAVPALHFWSHGCLRYCLDPWTCGYRDSWGSNRGCGIFVKLRTPRTQSRNIHHILSRLRCFTLRWCGWWRTWFIIEPRSKWFSFTVSGVVTWNKVRRAHWRRDGKIANAAFFAKTAK